MNKKIGLVRGLSYIHVMIKVMMNHEIYEAEQELARYNELMFNKEILNQEEYDFCFNWDHVEVRESTSKIGEGRYLNLNVYSEADKDEYDLRKEMGI